MQGVDLPFKVVAIDGKGFGAVATRDIVIGERVLAESALFTLEFDGLSEETANAAVDQLTIEDRARFFELCQDETVYGKDRTALKIFQNNSLPLGPLSRASRAGIFPTAARFNHACNPSIHHSWNAALNMETMHACRNIQCGEELLTSYIQLEETQERRRKLLLQHFGFTCSCSACSLQGEALAASNMRRSKLGLLDEQIASAKQYDVAIHLVQQRLDLLTLEGIGDPCLLSLTEYDAYRICKLFGKHKEARKWLRKVLDHSIQAEGHDSPACQRYERMLALPLKAPLQDL